MKEQVSEPRPLHRLCAGLLAHVDAGKTTLSEALLYQAHQLRSLGRVDHQNSFLDYDPQERRRGITIYAKQAVIQWQSTQLTLLDTPGHVDFSAEMERTLQVLDCAILVISATEGIQAHTRTIWKLLESEHIPVFLFINKMDIAHVSSCELIAQLRDALDPHCVDVSERGPLAEMAAMSDDALLEDFLAHGDLRDEQIAQAVADRQLFPCCFGSALKLEGISDLLDALVRWLPVPVYPSQFGMRAFKVFRDAQGMRLTQVKITGGTLKAKSTLDNGDKVDQIRLYSGNRFTMINEAPAGTLCALKGPVLLEAGQGLGFEKTRFPAQTGCLSCALIPPSGCDSVQLYRQLRQLKEEDPQLQLQYEPHTGEIRIQVMGKVQLEILRQTIADRFHVDVRFSEARISYRETILTAVEGIGHYEPLRHYAEVHLMLEPGEPGSGIQLDTVCPLDLLEQNWQHQVLSVLEEEKLTGVLTGAPLTDIKITLLSGKAHPKHTEGGDFRQATLRALRQGLRSTECVLLEPVLNYSLDVAAQDVSRALYDIERMNGTAALKDQPCGTRMLIEGQAPASGLQNYAAEVAAYTRGTGRLSTSFAGYQPCAQAASVMEASGYDPDADLQHPADSIFCSHGAGFLVHWYEIDKYMHLPRYTAQPANSAAAPRHQRYTISDAELKSVMDATYKPRPKIHPRTPVRRHDLLPDKVDITPQQEKTDCLLVDGYNLIHSWSSLKTLAEQDLGAARDELIRLLSSYQGSRKGILILVFDAYKVKDNPGQTIKLDMIYVIYTRTSQTADSYIERATHELASHFHVTVATSDGLEQLIILGQGAMRMSARELEAQVMQANRTYSTRAITDPQGNRPMSQLKEWIRTQQEDE